MNKKVKLLALGGVLALGATGLIGLSGVVGATSGQTSLVEALATKFNLNKDDVQKVFDEHKIERQAERETAIKTEIEQLVKDGTLTQAQADALTTKRAELAKQRETERSTKWSDMTDEQKAAKQTERETHRAELDKWFTDNGIDTQYRYLLGGRGGRGGKGGGFGESQRGKSSGTTNDNSSAKNS